MTSEILNKKISGWMDDLSIEQTEMESVKTERFDDILKKGTKVYVVHFPDKSYEANFEFIRKLIDQGMCPVPHIAARNLTDKAELKKILSEIQKLKLTEMLILGGGLNNQAGEFKTAHDLLKTGYFEDHGVTKLGIAVHPEKHPYATDEEILTGYQQKYEYMVSRKMEIYGMTQFCFSVEHILDLVNYLKKNQLPIEIKIGIVGKSSFMKLIKYSVMCGVGNSINVLKKEASNITKMALGYNPDSFIKPLAEKTTDLEAYNLISGLHLFPFGNLN